MPGFLARFWRGFKYSAPLISTCPDEINSANEKLSEPEYRVAFLAEQAFLLETAWKLTALCHEQGYSEFYARQCNELNCWIETRWENYKRLGQINPTDEQ